MKSRTDLSKRKALGIAVLAASQLILPLRAGATSKTTPDIKRQKMDIDRFVEDCINANKETESQAAVKEVLARAVSNPASALAAIGEPSRAGINVLHQSPTLTIFNAVWTPQMNLMPHNHLMWANIGIYTGREDNILWRRTSEGVHAYGADALFEGDAAALPVDAIHSVTNPLRRFTGGIHIYGGDFFETERSQWNPETLAEEPSDGAVIRAIFEQENERLGI
jgi:predicted metal-dependent enzyme (double-stranded beta helix superfamily)